MQLQLCLCEVSDMQHPTPVAVLSVFAQQYPTLKRETMIGKTLKEPSCAIQKATEHICKTFYSANELQIHWFVWKSVAKKQRWKGLHSSINMFVCNWHPHIPSEQKQQLFTKKIGSSSVLSVSWISLISMFSRPVLVASQKKINQTVWNLF